MSNEGSPSPSTSSATNATTTAASPEANGALKVAIVFVKQYYKCLSSHPDMLQRFYSALPDKSSYLSAGEGSEPTEPALLADSTPTGHDRWGCSEGEKMLFEFEDGAIDAQPSSNDGILMVVTASVIFKSGGGGGASCIERKKKFVQTFFLAKIGRNFAVTNDILRFLVEAESQDKATETESLSFPIVEPSVTEAVPVPEMKSTTVTTEEEKKSESTSISTNEDKKAGETSGDESSAPGGGVEESKEEAPEEEEGASTTAEAAPAKTANAKKRSNSKENKGKKNKGGKQQQQQQQPAVSKPVPGSWASLVVSGGSAPNTPSRPQEKTTKVATANEKPTNASKQPPLPPSDNTNKEEKGESEKKGAQEKDKSAVAAAATTTTNAGAGAKQNTKNDNKANQKGNNNNKENQNHNNNKERTKRDPDNTLVIKNLSENIKEQDILNMFQPFATATKTKIVGTNLNHHRMLAFVDYDGVAPVMAALKKHKETPFEWNGKVLEVDQKTMEQRARRNKAATNSNGYNRNSNHNAGRGGNNNSSNNNKFNNNNNQNNNNTNGRGDGGNNNDRGGRRRGTRAGR